MDIRRESHVTVSRVTRVFGPRGATGAIHALGPLDLDLYKGEFLSVVGYDSQVSPRIRPVEVGTSMPVMA